MILKLIELIQTPPPVIPAYEDEVKAGAAKIAVDIENEMFNKCQFNGVIQKAYFDRARTLIFNLKDNKNPEFRYKILEGGLTPIDLVTKDPKEFASMAKIDERNKT